jgi:hypothetical protein
MSTGKNESGSEDTTYRQDGQNEHPTRLSVPQKYSRNFQGIKVELFPSCLPADEDSPKRLPGWMTVIASVIAPKFPESTVSKC